MADNERIRYISSDGKTVAYSMDIPEQGFLLHRTDGTPAAMKKHDICDEINDILGALDLIGHPNHTANGLYFARI